MEFKGEQDYYMKYNTGSASVAVIDHNTRTEQITAFLPNDFFDKPS